MARHAHQSLVHLHAAQMRSWLTPSEALLWSAIKARQLGVQFRRQVVLGAFIADFLAAEASLIVEVDGDGHRRRAAADARRDRKLQRLGYRVLRLEAALVVEALPVAVERIRQALAQGRA